MFLGVLEVNPGKGPLYLAMTHGYNHLNINLNEKVGQKILVVFFVHVGSSNLPLT